MALFLEVPQQVSHSKDSNDRLSHHQSFKQPLRLQLQGLHTAIVLGHKVLPAGNEQQVPQCWS